MNDKSVMQQFFEDLTKYKIEIGRIHDPYFMGAGNILEFKSDDFSNKLRGGHNRSNDFNTYLANRVDKENTDYFYGIDSINI